VTDGETGKTHQMDQGGDPHPQGKTTSHEPWGGQLPTQPCVDCFLGTSTNYCAKNRMRKWLYSKFWWRLPVEVKTSRY